jgi:hypothetical protein
MTSPAVSQSNRVPVHNKTPANTEAMGTIIILAEPAQNELTQVILHPYPEIQTIRSIPRIP